MQAAAKPVRSLADRAGFLIVANLIKFAVGFLMPMVMVRLLTQSDYGTYQQLVLVGTTIGGVLVFGLPPSIYYFYHHVPRTQLAALIVQTSLMLGLAGLIAVAIFVGGADPIAAHLNNPEMVAYVPVFAVSLGFMIASEHSLSFMIAQDRYKLAVMFEIAESVVRALLMLVPLFLGFGLAGLIAGTLAYGIVRFSVRSGYLFAKSGLHFSGWSKHTFVRDQLAFSFPLALTTLTSLLGGAFNKAIVAAANTPAQYAIYSVGNLSIPLSSIFQVSVANVLRASLPPLARDGRLEEMVQIMRGAIRKLSIIILPSFIFALGYSHEIITTLFTGAYEDSVQIFRIIVWELPPDIFILSPILQVFGRTRLNLYINMTATVVLVTLSWVLMKWLGIVGAALALIGAQYLSSSIFLMVCLHLTKSTFLQLVPVWHIARVVLCALASLALARLSSGVHPSGLVNILIGAAIFSAVFAALAPTTGVLNDDDKNLIKRWIAKVVPSRWRR